MNNIQESLEDPIENSISLKDSMISGLYALLYRYFKKNLRNPYSLLLSLLFPIILLVFFGPAMNKMTISSSEFNYYAFFIPGILAMTLFSSTFYTAGNSVQLDKITEFSHVLIMTPNSSKVLVLGYASGPFVHSLFNIGCISLLSLLLYQPNLTFSYIVYNIIQIVMVSFIFTLLGLWIANRVDWQKYNFLVSFISLPIVYISTIFSPIENYETWGRIFILNPLTGLLDGLRYPLANLSYWEFYYALGTGESLILNFLIELGILVLVYLMTLHSFEQKYFDFESEKTPASKISKKIQKIWHSKLRKASMKNAQKSIDPIVSEEIHLILQEKLGPKNLSEAMEKFALGQQQDALSLLKSNLNEKEIVQFSKLLQRLKNDS